MYDSSALSDNSQRQLGKVVTNLTWDEQVFPPIEAPYLTPAQGTMGKRRPNYLQDDAEAIYRYHVLVRVARWQLEPDRIAWRQEIAGKDPEMADH